MQDKSPKIDTTLEDTLHKIPVFKQVLWLTKQIKLPGMGGLTF